MSGKLKEVKERISSVKSTQQITKAMKLVAASKLKKATDQIVQMRPYAQKLSEMLGNIAAATEGDVQLPQAKTREVKKALMVVVTSDRGLCGGFNSNIIKRARLKIEGDYAEIRKAGNLSIMCIGKKGHDAFKKYTNCNIITDYMDMFKDLNFGESCDASRYMLDSFADGTYDEICVSYAEFQNAVVQNFQAITFLPIQQMDMGKEEETSNKKTDYIFEPDKNQLIEELAPKILNTQFYSYLLDNNASEHGARMTAMDNATNNADELLKELKINYNKARQAAITTELTEIVSGAAALENG